MNFMRNVKQENIDSLSNVYIISWSVCNIYLWNGILKTRCGCRRNFICQKECIYDSVMINLFRPGILRIILVQL